MSRRVFFVAVLCAFAAGAAAQTYAPPRDLVSEALFDAIATEYSGAKAKENVAGIVQFHRIQASPGFSEARRWVVERLRGLGVTDVEVETFLSDGQRRYQTFTSPMAWTVREGELWVEAPFTERFCRYSDVPMCLTTLSKGGEWSGEVVHVGRGAESEDYESIDVAGKVVLASSYAALVHREAVIKRGALGVLIYPRASDPSTSLGAGRPGHPRMVRYNGLWLQAEEVERAGFGFQLSRQQAERLLVALEAGETVRVRASVDAEVHPGQLEVVSAFFRPSAELRASGTRQPEKEIILVAHLDHPKWSANDNASGSGALIEIARVLKTLREEGGVKLQRTIRLMWVPEYMGTMA
ncbi:MAG: M28 family peptidase, partial [Terriglobia bacterium]